MTTSPDLSGLLALQDLDTRIDQEHHRREHLAERLELAQVEAALRQAESARSQLSAALEEVASRQGEAEGELRSTEQRIAQVSARLYGGSVSASRELQALAADVDNLRKRASELEDRVLLAMEEREPLDAKMAELDQEISGLAERRAIAESRLASAEAEINAELSRLEASRPALAGAVLAELLSTYERLRVRLGGVAVARLVGGRCDGCHLSLPAVELDRIRHEVPGKLEYCEQCGRILVVGD